MTERYLDDTLEEIERKKTTKLVEDVRAVQIKESKKSCARLSPAQWREIEVLWETGEITLRELSERYGKHIDTFANHFKRHGIKKGAKAEELRKIAQEASKEQTRNEAEVISKRIRDTKEEHYKMSSAISKLVFNEILEVRKNGKQYRDIQADLKSLGIAMDTLKKAREERWAVLGLDKDAVDEDSLPELIMSTMTPEQALALREAQAEDDEEFGIDDEKVTVQVGNNNANVA